MPDGEAYRWLSRGLKESLFDFISRIKKNESLHVAIYEFFLDEIAAAFRAGDHATEKSQHALSAAGLDAATVSTPRTGTSGISHNKFVVHLDKNGNPSALWTASANFSENAFHFQTNCALTFDNPTLAELYEGFFDILKKT